MGRRITRFNALKVAQRIAQGYGQGTGRDYRPWLMFGDVSSRGVTSRLYSPKLDRPVLCLSNIERNAFLAAEHLLLFDDYHEQGPMARELTLEFCKRLDIPHPRYFGTREPAVLTYDGLLFRHGRRPQLLDCKGARAAQRPGDASAFAIRQMYAEHMNYSILRLTERSFSRARVHNLTWIRMSVAGKGAYPLPPHQMDAWATRLYERLALAIERQDSQCVRSFVTRFARDHHLAPGLGLVWLRQLLWWHHLEMDLEIHHNWLLAGPVHALRVGQGFLARQLQPA